MNRLSLSLILCLATALPQFGSAQSEADRRAVSYETHAEADKAMAQIYKVILGRLEGDERTAFIKAQRAWIAWRDAEAESDAIGFKETNDYGAFLADAKRDMTIARLATFMRVEANSRPFPKKKSR